VFLPNWCSRKGEGRFFQYKYMKLRISNACTELLLWFFVGMRINCFFRDVFCLLVRFKNCCRQSQCGVIINWEKKQRGKSMASNLKAKFEEMGRAPPPAHSVQDVKIVTQEEIRKKTWAHSGNSVTFPKSTTIRFLSFARCSPSPL